jgi:YidC/Oxa1 family membrane protein insertase
MQNLFEFIIHPLELGVIWLSNLVGNAGIGIILFTILVRLVLAPLLITQLRSSRQMQRVQPLIKELRDKHGKDRQALSQATMELYKEHKVNPAMGCLPTLVQFPILIGLFYAFLHLGSTLPNAFPLTGSDAVQCNGHLIRNAGMWYDQCYRVANAVSTPKHIFELFHANFLWLSNGLGKPDPFFILPILAGVTQWIQSRMMLQRSTDPQQQMMNSMMNFMPLLIVFFATRYASGLSLYWVTSTVIAIAIQYKITGWGLVPRPAAVMAAIANVTGSRSSSGKIAKRTAQKSSRPANPAPSTPARQDRSSEILPASDPVDGGAEPNGTNGAQSGPQRNGRTGQNKTLAQRRKANRAKGGRGGGRRS